MIALLALYKRHDEHFIIAFRSVFKFQIPMSELTMDRYLVCSPPSYTWTAILSDDTSYTLRNLIDHS